MKLLTNEIKSHIPKLYATESIPLKDKQIICKFFNPYGEGTWYVFEGEQVGDDFTFFGLVELFESELGYFSLNDLESVRVLGQFGLERDLHFTPQKVSEAFKNLPFS